MERVLCLFVCVFKGSMTFPFVSRGIALSCATYLYVFVPRINVMTVFSFVLQGLNYLHIYPLQNERKLG